MTCRNEEHGGARERRLPATTTTAPNNVKKEKCTACNSQLCSSYVVGLLACVLIIGGVFLAFQRWDYMWLVVTLIGIILTFVGASLHYCGTRDIPKDDSSRGSSRVHEISQSEHLLPPSSPNLNGAFSASQLSLSMLPPYFPSYDTMSLSTHPNSTASMVGAAGGISPIMQINGQSFLLLPIGRQISEDPNPLGDAQSILTSKISSGSILQLNREATEVNNELQRGVILIKSTDFQTPEPQVQSTMAEVVATAPIQQSVSQSTQTGTTDSVVVNLETRTADAQPCGTADDIVAETEPIYEVPRLLAEEVRREQSTLVVEPVNESVEPLDAAVSQCEEVSDQLNVATSSETPRTELAIPIVIDSEYHSRASTPDQEEQDICLCPPSYDEVTVNTRLGMPKFAYETM